jgi:hypothetical protein
MSMIRTGCHWYTVVAICIVLATAVQSTARTQDFAVEVSAAAQESPPGLDFSWVEDQSASWYHVFKKAIVDTAWTGPIAVLDGDATSFSDDDIVVGEAYEYSFRKSIGIISDTVAVATGTAVTFTIMDSWGDGICCDHGLGSYEVSGCGVVYASGGDFGSSESTTFTVGTPENPCSAVVVSITLDIFGEETSWRLTEDATGDTLAEGGPYSSPRFGNIFAGIRYPAPEDWGTVLLLVDGSVADSLVPELDRLELDMIRDGYRVCRREVPHGTPVTDVKDIVVSECQSDPTITTLFLLGNITVPYSGDIRGAHANHHGAWPADVYYGELDAAWTDSIVNNTTALRPANHNVPGDGKFDQTYIPSPMDLQVGRVDLSRMPTFAENEIELLRRYLDKDHAFRTGALEVRRRGRIDDNVGEIYGAAYACNGWRNFAAMFGPGRIRTGDWLPTLETEDYLCAYGCGPSSYTHCGGVATTGDFATKTIHAVFTMMMGSYFGDWDNTDNVLRAPLGAAEFPLTCCWAGRPAWHFHHMAMGYPVGYSTLITQNNHTLYMIGYGGSQIHIALMGDPTLRMFPVKPPTDLSLECHPADAVTLTWGASEDSVIVGYHVYRSSSVGEAFERLNPEMVEDTTYIDTSPMAGWGVYMVRAMKLETTGSGTFLNLSSGVIDSIEVLAGIGLETCGGEAGDILLENSPNPFTESTDLNFHLGKPGPVTVKIHDVAGRMVRELDMGLLPAGRHEVRWDGRDSRGRIVVGGVYFLSLRTSRGELRAKVIRLR